VRRLLLVVVLCGLTAGATAIAQDGDSRTPYELPEPAVHSAELLRLPSDARCQNRTLITARVLPPPGAVMGVVVVKVGAREAARMTGVPRAASATVRIGSRRTRVSVTGTTLGGQVVEAQRSYRRCGSEPRRRVPVRPTPGGVVVGGGDEG
jgi:hypothetical protein